METIEKAGANTLPSLHHAVKTKRTEEKQLNTQKIVLSQENQLSLEEAVSPSLQLSLAYREALQEAARDTEAGQHATPPQDDATAQVEHTSDNKE